MRKSRQGNPNAPRKLRCPCCFYLTLTERGGYEICEVCWWEDDGQDDETADEAWGGPNSDLSLTQGRYNFARIGASDWNTLRGEMGMPPSERAPGFPFADVALLTTLPPIRTWPDSWTLSFHPEARDFETRWRSGVQFLLKQGFKFQGTVELKRVDEPEWAHPRFMRFIEYDPTRAVERARTDGQRVLVGAWFTDGSDYGARLKFPSIFHTGRDWNEPAITIEAYVPQQNANEMFNAVVQDWSLALGNCSRTSWGLQTIAQMTTDFHVTQFLHGRTYLASSVARPSLVDGFERRFGPGSVESVPSGSILNGAGLRAGTEPEREAHLFLTEQLRRVALDIIASR